MSIVEDIRTPPIVSHFLSGFSTEVTARDHASLDAAGALLPAGTEVFVPFLPKDTVAAQATAAAQLRRMGLTPSPHVVARNLANLAELDETLKRFVGEAGVDRALVLAGDSNAPRGAFSSSLELIESGLFEKYAIRKISIACYPEEHPRIDSAALEAARAAKLAAAERAGLAVTLVSQMCFEASPIVTMARRIRTQGVQVPLRVGLAAPASRAVLLKYALICGIGPSLRVLRDRPSAAAALLSHETPEHLVADLARAQFEEPALRIGGIHFFTFASLASLSKWIEVVTRENSEGADLPTDLSR